MNCAATTLVQDKPALERSTFPQLSFNTGRTLINNQLETLTRNRSLTHASVKSASFAFQSGHNSYALRYEPLNRWRDFITFPKSRGVAAGTCCWGIFARKTTWRTRSALSLANLLIVAIPTASNTLLGRIRACTPHTGVFKMAARMVTPAIVLAPFQARLRSRAVYLLEQKKQQNN